MTKIKFTYFDILARGEAVRLALFINDIPFTDERVQFTNWGKVKSKTPYGQLPVLTLDNTTIAQTATLTRLAGKLSNLYPEDRLEAALVDEIIDTIGDLLDAAFRYLGPDDKVRQIERYKLLTFDLPKLLGGLESRLGLHGTGVWAVGGRMTVADLAIFGFVALVRRGGLQFVPKEVLDKYPNVLNIYNEVWKQPRVKLWYEHNPIVSTAGI